jgi:hypothetical protein
VVLQWKEELDQQFGLTFVVLDRDYLRRMRQERGFAVNPWATHSRFVVSHHLLRDEDYASSLRDWLGMVASQSLLVLGAYRIARRGKDGRRFQFRPVLEQGRGFARSVAENGRVSSAYNWRYVESCGGSPGGRCRVLGAFLWLFAVLMDCHPQWMGAIRPARVRYRLVDGPHRGRDPRWFVVTSQTITRITRRALVKRLSTEGNPGDV